MAYGRAPDTQASDAVIPGSERPAKKKENTLTHK